MGNEAGSPTRETLDFFPQYVSTRSVLQDPPSYQLEKIGEGSAKRYTSSICQNSKRMCKKCNFLISCFASMGDFPSESIFSLRFYDLCAGEIVLSALTLLPQSSSSFFSTGGKRRREKKRGLRKQQLLPPKKPTSESISFFFFLLSAVVCCCCSGGFGGVGGGKSILPLDPCFRSGRSSSSSSSLPPPPP